MKIFMFKSEARRALRAFAGDSNGSRLPENHGPWTVTGVVPETRDPPHGLPRGAIEKAINDQGFQLWRMRQKA